MQDKVILKNFSEVFEANKSTAIFGEADADTSIITKLIERFYDPQQGEILIGKENNCFVHLRSLRKSIGYVDRNPAIFNGTVRYNMKLSNPQCTDDDMKKVLEELGVWEGLRNGLDTVIGTAKSKLSGGQLQQIACARAFLKKPTFLLLDEATSAMD